MADDAKNAGPSTEPVLVTMEGEEQPSPLEEVAEIVARLFDSHPEVNAYSEGNRVFIVAEGATVKMVVLSVSADALDVLGDDAD